MNFDKKYVIHSQGILYRGSFLTRTYCNSLPGNIVWGIISYKYLLFSFEIHSKGILVWVLSLDR